MAKVQEKYKAVHSIPPSLVRKKHWVIFMVTTVHQWYQSLHYPN